MAATMGLFFVVVCAIGILRPIKNALALEGLGATEFYRVYLVSAGVVLFVPFYNHIAERVPWRWLVPGVALFFASNLVAFHFAFRQGSAALGLLFYGWFDVLSAVLVAQFFMATQRAFTAREAKQAYPLVVAGGAIGASLGGVVTGILAPVTGTGTLLLLAAALIAGFGVALPHVSGGVAEAPRPGVRRRKEERRVGVGLLARNPHVRLIAVGVLLTVVVKQLVDYQFNVLTLEVFRTRDAVSAFQGAFNAATQWLPIVVVLALRPLMRRWGVGAAVLLLPAAMLLTTLGMAVWWSLWTAVGAKAAETALRYSAERTGREILYIPLPAEIKLQARSYIDMAVENGIGKMAAAGVIFLLLRVLDQREMALAASGLSLLWVGVAVATRREYLRALARAVEGRFASLTGVYASLADASTRAVIHRALASGDPRQAAFVLDLLDQAEPADVRYLAGELHRLLEAPVVELRMRALGVLARLPDAVDPEGVRARLTDPDAGVRQAAVRTLCAVEPARRDEVLRELLASPQVVVRTAALSCLALGEVSADGARLVHGPYLERRRRDAREGSADARLELALAAGTLRHEGEEAGRLLQPLLVDPNPVVASAALRSAGLLERAEYYPHLIGALGDRATREAARDALARQGARVVPWLADFLLDPTGNPVVRRNLPGVLARIPTAESVDALLRCYAAPETDQFLDHRSLKALSKLRGRHPELAFDPMLVLAAVERQIAAAERYAGARARLVDCGAGGPGARLLLRALDEGWHERQDGVFRCLGLLHPPREVYRCYLAVRRGAADRRANGLEWLEQTIGYTLFHRVAPVLEPSRVPPSLSLCELWDDDDLWVARCALWTAAEMGLPELRGRLKRLLYGPSADGRRLAARLLSAPPTPRAGAEPMDLVEKVFLLQQIDLLQGARSAHLALLASIAEEIEVEPGTAVIRQGEPADALYVVIRGEVELRGRGRQVVVATDEMSFGSWALIDEAESLVEAHPTRATHLLRIGRDDFQDLLADHPELATGLLQGLARRIRTLVT